MRLIQHVEVTEIVMREMAKWYATNDGRAIPCPPIISVTRPAMVALMACDVRIFRAAFRLSCQDMRRMTVDGDRNITVWNRRAW